MISISPVSNCCCVHTCRRWNSGASHARVQSWTEQSRTSSQNCRSWNHRRNLWTLWTYQWSSSRRRLLNRWRCRWLPPSSSHAKQFFLNTCPSWRTSCPSSVRLANCQTVWLDLLAMLVKRVLSGLNSSCVVAICSFSCVPSDVWRTCK